MPSCRGKGLPKGKDSIEESRTVTWSERLSDSSDSFQGSFS